MGIRRNALLFIFAFGLLVTTEVATAQRNVQTVGEIENQDEFVKRLGDRSEAIFLDDNRLTFLYRTDAAEVELTNMIGAKIKQIGRTGTYIGQVVVPNSERLVMSYAFAENDENGWDKLATFRAPRGPAIPQSMSRIHGTYTKYLLPSEIFGEDRRVEVYEPNNESGEQLPVVYMTDGNALKDYVGTIDHRISQGKIAPIILVGMHSGGYVGDRDKVFKTELDHRAQEYLSGLGSERYALHKKFVEDEVIPFVEKNYPAASDRDKRVLSGYSNGGAYAVTASVEQPELFGHVMAYSVAFFIRDDLRESTATKNLPRYRLAAGELETFIEGTRDAEAILKKAGAKVSSEYYVAGHDPLLWRIALIRDLQATFPGTQE